MSSAEELRTFAGRLATFDGPKQFSKRRASSTKKKVPNTVSWPHKYPTPEHLAKAGFYYKPTNTSPDSVTCFLCSKSFDGWDSDDNPALEHLNHVPHCGWAINVCIEQRSQDMDRAEEDPLSEKMVDARRDTYQDAWPHEGKRGWKCKMQKMVNAGWSYCPLPEADDCVICFYCGLTLDGWEPRDDPREEHRRRAPDCHFFSLTEESAALAKASKGKKGRWSRCSKAPRMSAQSAASAAPPRLSLNNINEGLEPEEDSIILVQNTTTKKSKNHTTRTKVKNVTRKDASILTTDESLALEGDSVLTTDTMTTKTRRPQKKASKPEPALKRNTRIRKKTPEHESIEDDPQTVDSDRGDQQSRTGPAAKPTKPQRLTRKGKNPRVASAQPEQSEIAAESTDTKTRGRKQGRLSDDASQLQSELEAAAVVSNSPKLPAEPPKRGRKRASNGSVKLDSSVAVLEGPSEPSQPRGKTKNALPEASRSTKDSAMPAPEDAEEPALSPPAEPTQCTLQADEEGDLPMLEPEEDVDFAPKPVQKPVDKGKKGRTASRQQKPKVQDEPRPQPKPDEQPAETAPPPPKQTRSSSAHNLRRTSEKIVPGTASPTTSPQSSNAENHPPSSKPSFSAKAKAHAAPPLAPTIHPTEIRTPLASPSRRANIIPGALSSTQPWTAVDLEKIFLPSPRRSQSPSSQQEQQPPAQWEAGNGVENTRAAVEAMMLRVSAQERDMTVEEWILANAAKAEERLRTRCEWLIGKFEGEGMRALRVLEGVECV